MKKNIILLLLLVSTIIVKAQTFATIEGIRYMIEDDHAVVARQDKELSGDITIPSSIVYNNQNYNVTQIVDPTLIDVYADAIVEVEGGAFQDCQITSITLPNTIKVVSAGAFSNCQQLTKVTLPTGLIQIGAAAFSRCISLTSIDIPATVTDLGSMTGYGYASYAFGDCSNLTSFTIPDGIIQLGCGLLRGTAIKELSIPAGVKNMEGYSLAILSLEKLTINTRDHRTLTYSNELFGRAERLLDVSNVELVVPKGSHDIYDAYEPWRFFKSITEMDGEEVYITPDQRYITVDGVKYLIKGHQETGYHAIICRQEPSLSGSIVIPETVAYDGTSCPIWSIVEPESWGGVVGGYFNTTGGAFQGTQITEISLPGFRKIPAGTFADCEFLEKVTLREAVDTLGAACFANCIKLTTVDIKASLNHLGCDTDYGYWSYVFGNCQSLKSFTIPQGVTTLASGAFKNAGLETLVIPANVTSMGEYALELPNLKSLTLLQPDISKFNISGYAFGDNNDYLKQCDLIVPLGSGEVYGEYYPWMSFRSVSDHGKPRLILNGSEFSIPEGFFTHDTEGKFNFNSKFTDAVFDGIEYTSGLKMEKSTKLLFSTDVKAYVTIVQSVWSDSTVKLDEMELDENTEGLLPGDGCRYWTVLVEPGNHSITRGNGECGLFSVKLEQLYNETPFVPEFITTRIDGIRYILKETTKDEQTVRTATIGRQNVELEGDIVIPATVKYDDKEYTVTGFVEPTALDVYSDQNVEIKEGAFQGTAISGFTLQAAVKEIANGAFFECRQLTSVTLPDGIEKIGTAAFARCESLEELFLPESVTDLGNDTEYGYASYTFGGCTTLKKINTPTGVTKLAGGVFKDSGLETFLIPNNVKVLEPSSFKSKDLREFKLCHKQPNELTYTEAVFKDVELSKVILFVPEGSKDIFKEVYPWKDFSEIIEYVDQNDEHQYNAYRVTCEEEIEGDDPVEARSLRAAAIENVQTVAFTPSGVPFTLPEDPVKENYEFVGWKETPSLMPAEDIKLIAVFKTNFIKGDANNDKKVDVEDIVSIVNKILNEPADNFVEKAADVNNDGKIDIEDVVAIVNIILEE